MQSLEEMRKELDVIDERETGSSSRKGVHRF